MNNKQQNIIQLGPTASMHYQPEFISNSESIQLTELWIKELNWIQSTVSLFGKKYSIPRLNAWYGERSYSYSGTHFEPKPWTPELLLMKERVESTSKLVFNSVLINWYRDGEDSMGWHSDDEACLGKHPQIASVSLGDTRKFVLRCKEDHSNKHNIQLEDGSLLLMLGETQTLWQHALPKTKKSLHNRINLTFRLLT